MKKILFLAVLLSVTVSVSAQTYFNGARADYDLYYQSRWGFEAGVNLANVTPNANFETRHITGFSAGFNLDAPVSDSFSIMPALLYAQRGYQATTLSGNYSQRIQAVELPVLARFCLGNIVNFYVGPQLSYIVSASNSYSGNFPVAIRQYYEYDGANLSFQGVGGAGFKITKSFNIHARYSIDLTSTGANGRAQYVPTYRSHVFQMGFGINI